jgi:nucleoside-diphosphate kinase
MVWEGYNAVKFGRNIIGETVPSESPVGTIRGDYCLTQGLTVVHGSHSVTEAEREVRLWFQVCTI